MNLNQHQVAEKMAKFLWNYKVGDNIAHNFQILFFLYQKKAESTDEQRYLLNKPIIVTLVSLIEGIFYDFVCRLDVATGHFPETIKPEVRDLIKQRIEADKQWFPRKDIPTGEVSQYKRIKNYKLRELIAMFSDFELLGERGGVIYKHLEGMSYLRNRIHIFNWFGNFEIDEERVFSESRLQKSEQVLEEVLQVMEDKYTRPFESGQGEYWYSKMIF